MNQSLRLILALGLLLGGVLLGSPTERPSLQATSEGEQSQRVPSAHEELLSSLASGPRAVLGLALWLTADPLRDPGLPSPAGEALALALLRGAPDLELVRLQLVEWLVTQRASVERDRDRHRALVVQGLSLLEDGMLHAPSVGLHAALGRLLAEPVQGLSADPLRSRVAELLFGERSEEVAIQELRHAIELPREGLLLADLLFDRGKQHLQRYGDVSAALSDFQEAEALYRAHNNERGNEVAEWLKGLPERGLPLEPTRS